MSKIKFKERKEDQFIYFRNVIVASPPEYLSVKEEREIIISRIDDKEGNYQFQIQYNGAVTHLEFDSTVRDFPTIPEIESFCAGVDAGYESIFDFIPEN